MGFKTDIEIAQENNMISIFDIARNLNIPEEAIETYGKYKAKLDTSIIDEVKVNQARLILVTAINPTPAGEGKTTTTVGLGDGLNALGKKTLIALREPSLGPVFGVKGGAAGGGYAQVVPMEDINLHFTGDLHAIGAANNLLAALLDNHIHQGNTLNIDPRRIVWKRCVDMNDRQLRFIVNGLGGSTNGVPREDGFDITVASEIMAILCLATSIKDLKERLGRIVVAYTYANKPVTAQDLKVSGALATLLKDALKPNLVQTLEKTPAIVHGGPFANIAHGCNSIMATKMAMTFGDYVVTEAGFGADLGAEKFLDIKCRYGNLKPNAVVIVATIRALKYNGGVSKESLGQENLKAIEKGIVNLYRHIDNMKNVYKLPVIISLNRFPTDTEAEIALVQNLCQIKGAEAVLYEGWAKGSEGAKDLAQKVVELCEKKGEFDFSYATDLTIEEKILTIVQKIYHGRSVSYSDRAKKAIESIVKEGYGHLPICVAKTQYSFSDNPSLLGAPEDFEIHVENVKLSAGAGFIVVLTGSIMTMPGLPKVPAAENIDITDEGQITGLF